MQITNSEGAVINANYAGFWLRLVACMIDTFITYAIYILVLVAGIVIWAILIATGLIPKEGDNSVIAQHIKEPLVLFFIFAWIGIMFLSQLLYYPLFESSRFMATPGKLVLGLLVSDTSGYRISFARAFGRNTAKILSHALLYCGFICAAFTPKKQALHDILSRCLVLKKH